MIAAKYIPSLLCFLFPAPSPGMHADASSGISNGSQKTPYLKGVLSLLFFILSVLMLLSAANSYGATPAGTIIRSQAHAVFLDGDGTRYQATSNAVQTLIQEAPGVNLQQSQTRFFPAGSAFVFPHILTNTGNTVTDYQLSKPQDVRLYQDKKHNGQIAGQPEIKTAELITLAPGETFYFLANGMVTGNVERSITIWADVRNSKQCLNNNQQGRCFDQNTDIIKISKDIAYSLNKAMDKNIAQTGNTVLVSLDYQRLDHKADSSALFITDVLPSGMRFESENNVELCNLSGQNCHGLKGENITGISREGYKVDQISIDNELRDRVTVQLINHSSASKGKIRFKTRIQPGFTGQTLFNEARFKARKTDKTPWGSEQTSNRVPVKITGLGVTINGSPYSSNRNVGEPIAPEEGAVVASGSEISFINYLWNTGTEESDYTISLLKRDRTFPDGSKYCLTRDDTCSPTQKYPDVITVKKLQPGKSQAIVFRVKLPDGFVPDQNNKNGYSGLLKATSTSSDDINDRALNRLPFISDKTASVDLTYGSDLKKNSDADGKGKNKAPSSFKPPEINAAGTVIIDNIFVNNTGSMTDVYNLSFITINGKTLPQGVITARFFDSDNNVALANTGAIEGKSGDKPYKKLRLQISVPDGVAPDTYHFAIKTSSPVTFAEDQLPLSVKVVATSALILEPNGEGQVMPGSFITFKHRLSNTGNTDINNLHLRWTDTLSHQGWQSLVYETDENGVATGHPTNSIAKIKANETKFLIVKTFAPANAMQGAKNITTLTVSWGEEKKQSVTDTATVNNTNVVIIKEQAAWDCKSTVPSSFSKAAFPAKPETCVVYRLTATNQGAEAVQSVVIHDAAPNFTVFHKAAGLPKTKGRIQGRIDHTAQVITASWAQGLMPGESVSLIFGIRIQ